MSQTKAHPGAQPEHSSEENREELPPTGAGREEHARSHAAHLNDTPRHVDQAPDSKPAGNLRQGSYPSGRRQP